jgi:hypothetical protein
VAEVFGIRNASFRIVRERLITPEEREGRLTSAPPD